jgi:hypothetical protein
MSGRPGWSRPVLLAALALYLVGLGFLAGVSVERFRFDAARATVLARYTDATSRLRERLMLLEPRPAALRPTGGEPVQQ